MANSQCELCTCNLRGVCEPWSWHHPGREAQFLIFDNSKKKAPWFACCLTCSGLFNFASIARLTSGPVGAGAACMAGSNGRRLDRLHCFIVSQC